MDRSSIGWIDFSSEHRERVRTVLGLLTVPGVIDELGIRGILIGFADRMFPGISTIQTRAKYFTLTAAIIQKYLAKEKSKLNPAPLQRYLEREEMHCRIQLVNRHAGDGSNLGIIGSDFGTRTDQDVVRRPSSVYWTGLLRFGIVSPGYLSLAEFGRRISDDPFRLKALLDARGGDKGDDHDAEHNAHALRALVPELPENYWDKLSIELTFAEAEFLRHQIMAHVPDSLIGQILAKDSSIEQACLLTDTSDFANFAELPFIAELKDKELLNTVMHAKDFWTIMRGAYIRYNCLLQDAGFGNQELREELEVDWENWKQEIRNFPPGWDTKFLWALMSNSGSRVKPSTARFVESWILEAQAGADNDARCDELVRRQEFFNKGHRARLRPGNKEAINTRVGLPNANYRLPVVVQLVRDIYNGQTKEKEQSNARL